jgi:hypothetical protein
MAIVMLLALVRVVSYLNAAYGRNISCDFRNQQQAKAYNPQYTAHELLHCR